jgi:hypothetical protein
MISFYLTKNWDINLYDMDALIELLVTFFICFIISGIISIILTEIVKRT